MVLMGKEAEEGDTYKERKSKKEIDFLTVIYILYIDRYI